MSGTPPIDHDRFFKELLTTFFFEFLELFFPKIAGELDPASAEFLREEVYVDQLRGGKYRADIVVKARYKADRGAAFLIIHVEHQSTAPSDFGERFYRYFVAISARHGLPVYPIVIYSHDEPLKKQHDTFKISFPDGPVLRFHYRVVQLNRLPWRRFVNQHNPIASALMSKMKIAPRDRPWVKVQCLRILVTLKLDPARKSLISTFIDAYLRLNEEESRRFQEAIEQTELMPSEKEEIVEYVTSWEEKGREIGRKEGLQEGAIRVLRDLLLDVLTTRFGSIDTCVVDRIHAIDSTDELRRLHHQALTANSIGELGL